jgi:hypothetical protein
MDMTYRVEFEAYGEEGQFYANAMRFDTELDAKDYGQRKFGAWLGAKNFRVVEGPTERVCYTTEQVPA